MSDPEATITLTRKELTLALTWNLAHLSKDVSDHWHDVREYKNLDERDIDELVNDFFNDWS